ncbi:S8 family serine peptidase [Leptolyngbya sp. 15MV]|nr:S8 family serine peptidase [Leptolyngbya sp. 15MV]
MEQMPQMNVRVILISALALALGVPLGAQVVLPQVGPQVGVPDLRGTLQPVTGAIEATTQDATRTVQRLAGDRLRTIDRLVRRNQDIIERDARGDPARRGEILVMDATPEQLALARTAGFAELGSETIDGLELTVVRLRPPVGMDLAAAEQAIARLLPTATIAPDNLHFQSGSPIVAPVVATASTPRLAARGAPVGMIDGAPGPSVAVARTRGFADGAPHASNHGSAVASLLSSVGASTIHVADVYGTDKAGGGALAIARGLGWLVDEGSRVVTISLVGPKNAVLERAISSAQGKGVVVVAAVGNDGPAAPPAYPASYSGVVAVTAVDRRRQVLIEAGRALHLDYAAPGADIHGLDARGRRVALRGTSYATPLVAARIAVAIGGGMNWRVAVDAEAIDLGPRGHDAIFGRGLVCATCRGR